MGDSKSALQNSWPETLVGELDALLTNEDCIENTPRNWATGGNTAALLKSLIDSFLLVHFVDVEVRNVFLINLGAADLQGGVTETSWKTNYKYILDAVIVKYPDAVIYITKPWRRGYAANCNTLAGWIDDIVALYSGNVLVGDDERTWLEGGDDGATMTIDGIHYSTAGQTAKIAAVRAILGY